MALIAREAEWNPVWHRRGGSRTARGVTATDKPWDNPSSYLPQLWFKRSSGELFVFSASFLDLQPEFGVGNVNEVMRKEEMRWERGLSWGAQAIPENINAQKDLQTSESSQLWARAHHQHLLVFLLLQHLWVKYGITVFSIKGSRAFLHPFPMACISVVGRIRAFCARRI